MWRSRLNQSHALNKKCLFISGPPRSGTSLITKIIDSHPEVGVVMEAIFKNRRRHNVRASYWSDNKELGKKASTLFNKLPESIIGNKVCNPDVWSLEDILQFCNLFSDYNIIWVVRDPIDNLKSRYYREPQDHYNHTAKAYLPLDYSTPFTTWASSWNTSIENYRRLKNMRAANVHLIYYDDFIQNFEVESKLLFSQLNIPFHTNILKWDTLHHYDNKGIKRPNLKYYDEKVKKMNSHPHDQNVLHDIKSSLIPYKYLIELWEKREL